MVGCLLAVIYRQALHHAARPPDVGVPPSLWKPLFTDWADASSPPHLLTGASTVCYRGGQSDELSGSQLSTLPSSTTWSSTTGVQKHHKKNNKAPIQMDGEDNLSSCPDGENTVLQLSTLQKGGSTTLFSFCFSKKHKLLILDHTSKPNKPRKLPPKKKNFANDHQPNEEEFDPLGCHCTFQSWIGPAGKST
jgi:hypothetical protein